MDASLKDHGHSLCTMVVSSRTIIPLSISRVIILLYVSSCLYSDES